MREMRQFNFYGYRLSSPWDLSWLSPWQGSEIASGEVTLLETEVPESLPDSIERGPFIEIDREGEVLLNMKHAGRFLLRDGREILVSPYESPQSEPFQSFLTGTVAGLLFHQNSRLVLHASAVVVRGRAILLSGWATVGKSALAAALMEQGAEFLSDDLCLVDVSREGAMVSAGPSRIRLWPDVGDYLGFPEEARCALRPGLRKFTLVTQAALPVRAGLLVRVEDAHHRSVHFERLRGMHSVMPPHSLVYQHRFAGLLQRQKPMLTALSALAAEVPVIRMGHPHQMQRLREIASSLLQHVEAYW
ncbi:hypothetical protein FTW19_20060 [Terriglobus albidus]|uniref:HPr kinase/phosphorylase C-terminal domain-containing protein n=1 Tax=Terriglobus albidus TaxID=1592106 RepID=A0A5B9ED25_9BACT|nr:hypothetical protein [Terriglobus albidus]QEE30073.1 hypothetical protein FTW19_20060 [Terriglobus albidus]